MALVSGACVTGITIGRSKTKPIGGTNVALYGHWPRRLPVARQLMRRRRQQHRAVSHFLQCITMPGVASSSRLFFYRAMHYSA